MQRVSLSDRKKDRYTAQYHWKTLLFWVVFLVWSLIPLVVWAGLENPAPASVKSGVSVVSGWICDAKELEVSFDGGPRQFVPYGSERPDTTGVCGDTDNGFSLLINYNELGDGEHTATLYVDGQIETTRAFFVLTLGEPFLRGVKGVGRVALSNGESVVVRWDEAIQGFTILDSTYIQNIQRIGNFIGRWRFTAQGTDITLDKIYHIEGMGTNLANQGHIVLSGYDDEDKKGVSIVAVQDFTPGSSLPWEYALFDGSEINTRSGELFCLTYYFDYINQDSVQGNFFIQRGTQSGCELEFLGDPDGYPFSANRIQ